MPIEIIALILQILLKFGPQAAKAAQELFSKKDITQADWDQVWAITEKPWPEWQNPPQPTPPPIP